MLIANPSGADANPIKSSRTKSERKFGSSLGLLAKIACALGILSASSARSAAPTYLLSEGFEGPGYENSGWVVPPNSASAPEPDHTGTVLLGTQSLRCSGISFIQRPFVRQDSLYCYLRVHWAAWSDYKFVVDWLDAGQNSTATLLTSFGNKLEIKHGSVSVPGTTTIALNTTYHVWLEWTKGSGNNGTMKLFVSTDGTKPTAPETFITTGNGIETGFLDVGPFGTGVDVIYDSILIDDEPIGSNPGGNAPPSISDIANQSAAENMPTVAIPFTIGDLETNAADLILTGTSSNQDVIPNANIVFGGSESNRTVTLTPAPNQSGLATITLTVSDGAAAAVTSFAVTVGTFNSAPTISSIANQSTIKNTATAAIPFAIGDAQTNPDSLTVDGNSSNTALVPNGNIVFGGTGTNRTITITPAGGETGTTTIFVRVDDGQLTNSSSFTLTVSTLNTPPTISATSGQTVPQNTVLGPLSFTIGDSETPVASLILTGSSSNPDLVPDANIVFGGSNENRTVTIIPASGQSGNSTITVMVNDGELTVSRSFLVTVIPNGTGTPGGLLFEEGFEGPGYENSGWSEIGLPDPNYTNQVLRGSHSLNLTGSQFVYRRFVATNHFDLYLRARWNAWVDYINFIYFETADYQPAGSLFADNNRLQVNHGNFNNTGTTPINPDTTYHIWLEWIRGSGTDGTMNLYVSTNVIKPSLPDASISTGDGDSIERVYFGSFDSGFDVVIDSIFIDDETIGSNPLGNQPPIVSVIADQSTDEDSSTEAIAFVVGDLESPASSLRISGVSSDTNLVPNANIVFGGGESNRTVTVTPAPNQFGTATITVQVRDNALTTNTTFQLTVNSINDAPVVNLPGEPLSFVEGSAAIFISTNATLIDSDSPSLGGGRITVIISENGAPDDRLAIRHEGAGPGEIEVSGIGVGYEGVGIGTFSGGSNDSNPLVILFNRSATPQAAQALLRNITFETISETPSILSRTISVVVEDGQGGTSIAAERIVNVTGVPSNPRVTWPSPTPIVYGNPLSELQLTATANAAGDFTYLPPAGTILNAGVELPLSVIFNPTDAVNFNSVTTSVPLTVTPAPLLVTANNTNRFYGDSNPICTATITGFANDDDETDLLGTLTFFTLAATNSPVGEYALTPAGLNSTNYTIAFAEGILTITTSTLVIKADDQSKLYGAELPSLTGTITGVQNGDAITSTFTTTATATSDIGLYPITAVLSDPENLLTNYVIALVNGTITNLPAPLLVTANDTNRIYGLANPEFSATITGFVNGDDESGLDAPVTLFTTADVASPTGSYDIVPAGATDLNYTITFANGSLAVTPAGPLTLTLVSSDTLGNVALRVTSDPGQRVKIQASTNLTAWDDLTALDNTTGSIDYTDTAVSIHPRRFYRAVLAPGSPE